MTHRRPELAAALLPPEMSAAASTVTAALDGSGPLTDLSAQLAARIAPCLSAEQRSAALVVETRPTVRAALGDPSPPKRRSAPPLGDVDLLLVWLSGRSALDADRAVAAVLSVPAIDRHSVGRAAAHACSDVSLPEFQSRLAAPGFPLRLCRIVTAEIGTEGGRCRTALREVWVKVCRDLDTGVEVPDPDDPDPRWWRVAEAVLTASAQRLVAPLPESVLEECAERVSRLGPLCGFPKFRAAMWLARSGAPPELVEPFCVDMPASQVAAAASFAQHPDTALMLVRLAVPALASSPESGRYVIPSLIAKFGALLSDAEIVSLIRSAAANERDTAPSTDLNVPVDDCGLQFLWHLAAGRCPHPFDGDRFARILAAAAEDLDVQILLESAVTHGPTYRRAYHDPWNGPHDRGAPALVEMFRLRLRLQGVAVVLNDVWAAPAAATALAEELDKALRVRGADASVPLALEFLDGWEGTIDDLAETVAASQM